MVYLFLLDIFDNGIHLDLNCRDEKSVQYVLQLENAKRVIYFVFKPGVQNILRIIDNYLHNYKINLEDTRSFICKKDFIHPQTRKLVHSDSIVKVIFNRRYFETIYDPNHLKNISSHLEFVIGKDTSATEYLVSEYKLKGWIFFDEDSKHVQPVTDSHLFRNRKQFILKNTFPLGEITPQPPTPDLLTWSLYYHTSNSTFFMCDNRPNGLKAYNLSVSDVNEHLQLGNPAIVCVHDFHALPKSLNIRAASENRYNLRRCEQLVVDTMEYTKDLKPMEKDYSLNALVPMRNPHDMLQYPENILALANSLGIIELIFQISIITGQPCSKVPSKLGRVEWMLILQFIDRDCIPPDKLERSVDQKSYTAGLVLQPVPGIYDEYIILLDFLSLYPSLCIEYDICFSEDGKILKPLLLYLIETRKEFRAAAENDPKKAAYCLVLKLLANTIYGCLACPWSRFYSLDIAKRITQHGRNELQNSIETINHMKKGLSVMYGDTDSLFVKSHRRVSKEETRNIANEIVSIINAKYKYLRIKHEATFEKIVIFGKKHYFGKKEEPSGKISTEIKGMDLLKRGFPPFAAEFCKMLVELILNAPSGTDIVSNIYTLFSSNVEAVKQGALLVRNFVITTELSRALSEYVNVAGQYHVIAARKLILSDGVRPFRKGDFVNYIMTNKTDPILSNNSELENTLVSRSKLILDIGWYLTHFTNMVDRMMVVFGNYSITELNKICGIRSIPNQPSSSSSYIQPTSSSSSHSSSFSKKSQISPELRKEIEHPSNYFKKRTFITLKCESCGNLTEYKGLHHVELLILKEKQSQLKDEDHDHEHISEKDLNKVITSVLKVCRKCRSPHDFDILLFNPDIDEDSLISFFLNIDAQRIINQHSCLKCKKRLFYYFKEKNLFSFFQDLTNKYKHK